MNPEYDLPKEDLSVPAENDDGSIDDFIKELEAKERDLHLSYANTVVEIDSNDIEDDEIKELEKLLASYETSAHPQKTEPVQNIDAVQTTNIVPHHAAALNLQASADMEAEILSLRGELSKMSLERAELSEALRRRQFDFESFRNRTERERGESYRNLVSNMAMRMLPVIDNLGRALNAATSHQMGESKDFQQFVDGIALVNDQLNDTLEEMGIRPILAVGEPFDPHFHEAVATEPSSDVPPNTVIEELMRGYKLEEKVIRPAMVKVAVPVSLPDEPLLEFE